MHLTVIHPFGPYKRGDKITDTDKIREILEGKDDAPHENVTHVVKTADTESAQ